MQKDNYNYEKTKLNKKVILAFSFLIVVAIALAISLPLVLSSNYLLPKNASFLNETNFKKKVDNKEEFVLFVGDYNSLNSNYFLRGDYDKQDQISGVFSNYSAQSKLDVFIYEYNQPESNSTSESALDYYAMTYEYLIEKEKTTPEEFDSANFFWFRVDKAGPNNLAPNSGSGSSSSDLEYDVVSTVAFNDSYTNMYNNFIQESDLSKINSSLFAGYWIEEVEKSDCQDIKGNIIRTDEILFNSHVFDYCFSNGSSSVSNDPAYNPGEVSTSITGSYYIKNTQSVPSVMWFGTKPDDKYGLKGITQSYLLNLESLIFIENYLYF